MTALGVAAQGTEPFDLALAGRADVCPIMNPNTHPPYVSYLGISTEMPTDIRFIAPAGSGRVFAMVNPRAEIVELRPDLTRTPVFPGMDGLVGRVFVVDAAGNIYLATDAGHVLAIRPDGTVRADFALNADIADIDLAADQCTLFYNASGPIATIRRFDVCTGTSLSDFASGEFEEFALLPDGGLVVLTWEDVATEDMLISRFDAAGTLVRTYPLLGFAAALSLGRAGTSMLTAPGFCGVDVHEYDLATGTRLRTVDTGFQFVDDIIAYTGFTAALGPLAAAHVAAAVPSLSTSMLVVLGALLGLVAFRRLV
jgi:outer membrane protein assembly factor BamB